MTRRGTTILLWWRGFWPTSAASWFRSFSGSAGTCHNHQSGVPMSPNLSSLISRRALLLAGGSTVAGVALAWRDLSAAPPPKEVTIVEFSDAGVRGNTVRVPKVVKTDSEWLKQLPKASYWVTRREETEAPFSGSLLNNHEAGVYRCICC